jgi:hypothetical protein
MERSDFLARLSSSSSDEPRQGASVRSDLRDGRLPAVRGCVDLFIDRLNELGVEAQIVSSRQDAKSALEGLVIERAWSRVACAPSLKWPGISEKWTAEAGEASFGLCEADWAVAETGSVVVKSSVEVRRGYSLLPSAVGFFVSDRCICATVGDVLNELAALEQPLPSCISFISGPSNTADIASVHVVGVHGPREVHVWVIAAAADGVVDHGDTKQEAQDK